MSDSARQLRRLLEIIPRCADDRPHRLADVASETGTDERTLLRDLRALAERYDDPAGFVEGVQIYLDGERVQLRTDHFLRPMRLTAAELAALDLGFAMLQGSRPPDEHAGIERARRHLQSVRTTVVTEDAPGALHASLEHGADPVLLSRLRKAIAGHRRVTICYQSSGSLTATPRTVAPCGLLHVRGRWYLAALAEGDSLRVYRVDRIGDVTVEETRFEPLPGLALEDFVKDGRAFLGDAIAVMRVRYSARIAPWIRERETGTVAEDGSVVVEHPLADQEWAVSHVLQYGPEAEVLDPESVRKAIRERLLALLSGHA